MGVRPVRARFRRIGAGATLFLAGFQRMARIALIGLMLLGSGLAHADDVDGFGRTLDDAKADARQHALERLQTLLENHMPPLDAWKPTLKDMDGFLDGPGRAGGSVQVEPLGVQHQWIVTVRYPSDAEMEQRDRKTARQTLARMVMLAAIAGCAAAWVGSEWRRARLKMRA
jgi:hypothetical protein